MVDVTTRTTLTTPGLRLSPPTLDDVGALTLACQDPDVAAWTTVPSPYSEAHAAGFVEHWVAPGWATGRTLTWALRPDGDVELAGMVGLDKIADGAAELGFWSAPWARRRGLMTRAVGVVLDAAFDADGLDLLRVTWRAYVGNWPSRRVAWRAGFRFEGTLRLDGVQRDVRRDQWVAGLVATDARGVPAEPWPDAAPSDLRPDPDASPGVPLAGPARERMGA